MEIGRVALVNYGKDYGKLVVIVDVIDQNRVSRSHYKHLVTSSSYCYDMITGNNAFF